MIFRQPVRQVMKQANILDIREADPLAKAISILDEGDISALPVRSSDGSKYCGVLSKSDISSRRFLRLLEANRKPDHILVRELMNRSQPLFVTADDTVQAAIDLMHRCHIHRLFVSDDQGQLIGVISTSDILRMLVVSKAFPS